MKMPQSFFHRIFTSVTWGQLVAVTRSVLNWNLLKLEKNFISMKDDYNWRGSFVQQCKQ